jgi:hypothetical protein
MWQAAHVNAPVQACGVELRQDVDLRYAAVEAVAHGHIDETIHASNRDCRFGPLLGEWVQACAGTATQNHSCAHTDKAVRPVRRVCQSMAENMSSMFWLNDALSIAWHATKTHQCSQTQAPVVDTNTERVNDCALCTCRQQSIMPDCYEDKHSSMTSK